MSYGYGIGRKDRNKFYQDYIKGESWKCSKSPTGSHYWIFNSVNEGICKFCGKCNKVETEIIWWKENSKANKVGK